MTFEDLEIDGTWAEADLNMALSMWVRQKSWGNKETVIGLTSEAWRNKSIVDVSKITTEYYKFNIYDRDSAVNYEPDKEATDWDSW